ncbi:MAG: MCP four helix bundle domain-containing protein [Bacteroidota bacterium]
MKRSIRVKFIIGILFFFVIITVLSVFSAYYLNKLSTKTNAILQENHNSVVYARKMSESIKNINQEVINGFLTQHTSDSVLIMKEVQLFEKSLQLEKDNITELGEDELAIGIEKGFAEFRDTVRGTTLSRVSSGNIIFLQKKFDGIYQQISMISQINEKAIESKTNDAKLSAKNALIQMTIIATLSFLIALAFTYSFGSYFNERFFQLYNGIKQIVSSNFGQRLHFEGKDEFYDISLVFNEMAEKLSAGQKSTFLQPASSYKQDVSADIEELNKLIHQLRMLEERASDMIVKLETKK